MSTIKEKLHKLIEEEQAVLEKAAATIDSKISDLTAQLKKLEKDRKVLFHDLEDTRDKLLGKGKRGPKGKRTRKVGPKSDFTGKWKPHHDKKRDKWVIHHETTSGEWKGRPGPLTQEQQEAISKRAK